MQPVKPPLIHASPAIRIDTYKIVHALVRAVVDTIFQEVHALLVYLTVLPVVRPPVVVVQLIIIYIKIHASVPVRSLQPVLLRMG